MIKFANAFLAIENAILIDTDAPLDGAKVMLFTNSPALGLDTVTGDLTVPTFTGYAAATVTFEEAVDDTGRKYLIIPPEIFSPTNATNLPQTIMGAAVTDDANAYLFGGYFDTPVILAFPDQQLHVSAKCKREDAAGSSIEGYVS